MRRSNRRESALEAWCVKWARARGVQVSKNTELVGIPDRTFWIPGGRPLVPEFKRPDGKGEPSPAQVWHMKKLREIAPQYVQKDDSGNVKGYDIDGMANGALAAGINPQTVAGLRNTYAESVKNLAAAGKAQLDLEQEKNDKAFEVLESLRSVSPKKASETPAPGAPVAPAPAVAPQPAPNGTAPVPGIGRMPQSMLPNAQGVPEQPLHGRPVQALVMSLRHRLKSLRVAILSYHRPLSMEPLLFRRVLTRVALATQVSS